MHQVSASFSPLLPCHLLACCTLPRHHLHFIMSSCASHFAYMFVSCIRAFSPLSIFAIRHSYALRRSPFCLLLRAGVKGSRNGPSLAKRPWYTTRRPPVKFRAIWGSFDTPTVNRVTVKAPFVLQPNTLPKWPKTHLSPFHALGRSITIAWPKTVLHLDSPSSQKL